jgi:hypothetical protein
MLDLSTASLIEDRRERIKLRQRVIQLFGKSFDVQCQYIFSILETHLQYVREAKEN